MKKDTSIVKDFIKSFVSIPRTRSEIISAVDEKYVETKDEAYHLLGHEIGAVIDEIDAEWHPKEALEIDQ